MTFLYRRYPDMTRISMWTGLVVCTTSLLVASFVNEVRHVKASRLRGRPKLIPYSLDLAPPPYPRRNGGIWRRSVVLANDNHAATMVCEKKRSCWWTHLRWNRNRRYAIPELFSIVYQSPHVLGFICPLLVNKLLTSMGHRWTLRIWAVIQAIAFAIATFGIRPREPPTRYRSHRERPSFLPARLRFIRRAVFWTYVRCSYTFANLLSGTNLGTGHSQHTSSSLLFPSFALYCSFHDVDLITSIGYDRLVSIQLL